MVKNQVVLVVRRLYAAVIMFMLLIGVFDVGMTYNLR
jgi:hypothetical protein